MSLRASTITSGRSQNSRSTQILFPRSRLLTLRFERLSCIKLQLHVIYTKEAPVSAKVTPQITVENETRSQNIGTGEHFCHLEITMNQAGKSFRRNDFPQSISSATQQVLVQSRSPPKQ